jgi:hypothetical protein
MDQYCNKTTRVDVPSNRATLAVMNSDGADLGGLATTLTQTAGKLSTSLGLIDPKHRSIGTTFAKVAFPDRGRTLQ